MKWDIAAGFEEDTDTSCWIVANALFDYGIASGNPRYPSSAGVTFGVRGTVS